MTPWPIDLTSNPVVGINPVLLSTRAYQLPGRLRARTNARPGTGHTDAVGREHTRPDDIWRYLHESILHRTGMHCCRVE